MNATSRPVSAARPSPHGSGCGSVCASASPSSTGLVSHWAQTPSPWLPFPTSPSWGYRVTQGVHVIAGTAAVPLLLVKLWTVFPKLLARPPREARDLVLHGLERISIAVLVAAAIFQLATGLANAAQWYPWHFNFRPTHYALAWIAIGSLLVHVAVKLPTIRVALTTDVDSTDRTARRCSAGAGRDVTSRAAAHHLGRDRSGGARDGRRHGALGCGRSRCWGFGPGTGRRACRSTTRRSTAGVVAAATSASYRLTVAYGDRAGAAEPDRPAGDAADDRLAADRVCRGLERGRDLDRRPGARPARPGRRPARAARCSSSRCRSTAVSG